MGIQNIITSIDPETGAKEIDPELIPGTGRPMVVCPHAGGGRSWIPGSYNPETKTMFVPAIETCMDLNPIPEGERGFLSTGVGVSLRPRPDSDGLYGRVQAINMETRDSTPASCSEHRHTVDRRWGGFRGSPGSLVHGVRRCER